jgi:Fic family protein
MSIYIHQKSSWPSFFWDDSLLSQRLGEVRHLQGKLLGKMESLGFELQNEALLDTLTLDVLKSTEIEGEFLNPEQVRSSIARKLGMELAGAVPSDRNVDGMVDMMMDATQNCFEPLTADRLFGWHSALFPSGRSGMYKILVGNWREDSSGPMQVVSGALGREIVHFQAPDSSKLPAEMERFLNWLNAEPDTDEVIKSAVAHLWFVTVHPFDDGNGMITRALTDMLLARSDRSTQRFYSMSAQIRLARKSYYDILEKTQRGDLDITDWLIWFLDCLLKSLKSTESVLAKVLQKANFWQIHASSSLSDRQKMMLNKLFDGFEGKLNTSKWAKITKTSTDTALRDIQDLVNKDILKKEEAGGRSTNYEMLQF